MSKCINKIAGYDSKIRAPRMLYNIDRGLSEASLKEKNPGLEMKVEQLLEANHLTMEQFDKFEMGVTRDSEPGIHFGLGDNTEAGEKLMENKKWQIDNNFIGKPRKPVKSDTGFRKIKVKLNISKPLRVYEEKRMMGGRWDAHQIGRSVFEVDKLPRRFTEADREAWYEGYLSSKVTIDGREVDVPLEVNKDGSTPDWDYSELDVKQESEWINNFLNDRGYDHIIYNNAYEGGGDSISVYDLNKIKN